MSKNQSYADKYAEAAMEQMKRYGIPAVMERVNCHD